MVLEIASDLGPMGHDPDPVRRSQIAELCSKAIAQRLPVTVVANNKAEGSAPKTLFLLAEAIRERLATV